MDTISEFTERQSPTTLDRQNGEGTEVVKLRLEVTDPELIVELLARAEGEERREFALLALRIGILTLKQATGRLDADTIKHEADRLLSELSNALTNHQNSVAKDVEGSLEKYFDPKDGRFSERIDRLISKNGELELFMNRQVGSEDSQLAKTLSIHLGENSPIMKLLSPKESEGFLKAMTQSVEEALTAQRNTILSEFSLDNKESALSRLVKRVETSQGEITDEFSLDKEDSALARLKRELTEVLSKHKEAADEFREVVTKKLTAMTTRREESLRSTRHGEDFQNAVKFFVSEECNKTGDIPDDCSRTTGIIKNSKVGDLVIELGPDCSASGTRVVIESKESSGYSLSKALGELEIARKNRSAQTGVFVFSKMIAPPELEPMRRYGNDIVAVWDADDISTDAYLSAALSVARAICTQEVAARSSVVIDFEPAEKAIRAVEKLSEGLNAIQKAGETIQSGSERILERVKIMEKELKRQVEILDGTIADLKTMSSPHENE